MDLFSIKGGRKRRLYQRRARKTESLPRVQSMTRKQIKHQPFACTWLPCHSFPNLLSSKANLTLRNPRHCPMLSLKMEKQPKLVWCLTSVVTAGDHCWCDPQLHLPSVLTLAFIKWVSSPPVLDSMTLTVGWQVPLLLLHWPVPSSIYHASTPVTITP